MLMLDPRVVVYALEANYATLSTLMPDGAPQNHVMWVGIDDAHEHLLINTEVHRRKYKNMMSDPRVSIAIWHRDDAHKFVEVRGTVVGTVGGDEARSHISALSWKYLGHDYSFGVTSERVIVRIAPTRQIFHI